MNLDLQTRLSQLVRLAEEVREARSAGQDERIPAICKQAGFLLRRYRDDFVVGLDPVWEVMMLWALLAGFSDLGDQLSAADYHAAIRMADE